MNRQPRPDPLGATLRRLESAIALIEAETHFKATKDMYLRGCRAGYILGLKHAIDIVNVESGAGREEFL